MPRRVDLSSILIACAGPLLLTACGAAEAQPAQMEEAARACAIRVFAVAASGAPDQSRYALHYDSGESGIDAKLDCYGRQLEARGYASTLGIGSAGFDPRTDDTLLFARIEEACGLPPPALTKAEDGMPTIFANGLDRRAVDCAVRDLRRSGRFARIEVRPGEAPPPPALGPDFLGGKS